MSSATVTVPHRRGTSVARVARPRPAASPAARPAARPAGRPVARDARPVQAQGSVRLTRRGRVAVLLAVLAMAFAAFTLLGGPAVSTGETHHPAQHTVVVRGGETLWDIATRIAPGEDPRSVIADIVDLNNLPDAGSIRVGQQLYVPAS